MKNLLVSLIILFVTNSCDMSDKTSVSKEKKSIVCLLDISDSTKKDNLEVFLDNIAKEGIAKLDDSTSLVILAIDNGSQTAATPLFQVDMSEMDFVNPSLPMTIRNKMAARKKAEYIENLKISFKQKVLDNIEKRSAYATHTDIFGSLGQLERYQSKNITVMIFSDMINYSEEFDMETLLKHNRDLMKYIDKTPKIKNQSKINVYISTGANVNLGPKKFNALKEFWETYLKQYSFTLIDYTSGNIHL